MRDCTSTKGAAPPSQPTKLILIHTRCPDVGVTLVKSSQNCPSNTKMEGTYTACMPDMPNTTGDDATYLQQT